MTKNTDLTSKEMARATSDWRATHNRLGGCSEPGEMWVWIKNDNADAQTAPLTPAMAIAFGRWLVSWGEKQKGIDVRERSRNAWRDWDEEEIQREVSS